MLHLLDDQGNVVEDEDIRCAVNAAYRKVVRSFPAVDNAVVANLAERVARAIVRRRSTIASPQRYAVSALKGKVLEWLRSHPGRHVCFDSIKQFEISGGTGVDLHFRQAELAASFARIKKDLSRRDAQIFSLMEQERGTPVEIAAVLGIGYSAAAKALERTKKRVAPLLAFNIRHIHKYFWRSVKKQTRSAATSQERTSHPLF